MLELQRNKHVLPPATSHNVIKWKREMETMTLNNYLGKIFFLYLSQCELCLHCVVSLWAIDTGSLPFVQVMLIFAGHSPGVCVPRQLGQWVRKSSSPQSLTQQPAARIYCTIWPLTEIAWFLKNVLCLLRTGEGKKTPGQEEQPKNNSKWQSELCASAENQVPEASKGHRLQSNVCSFTARSLKCQALW